MPNNHDTRRISATYGSFDNLPSRSNHKVIIQKTDGTTFYWDLTPEQWAMLKRMKMEGLLSGTIEEAAPQAWEKI